MNALFQDGDGKASQVAARSYAKEGELSTEFRTDTAEVVDLQTA